MSHPTRVLLLILAARLLLGLAYTALIPLGEAPDEADHYAYAAFIGTEQRLPEGPAMTQAKHPPLVHLLAAAVAAPIVPMDVTFLRSNPDVSVLPDVPGTAPNFFIHTRLEDWPWQGGALAMHLARLVSVAAGLLLTVATYGLGLQLWPDKPALALAAAAFVAFLPESLFVGGALNNDMLAAALGTAGLWAALAAARMRPRRLLLAAGAGLLFGLAFLTKVSTAALWPVAALAMWLDSRQAAREAGLSPAAGAGDRGRPQHPVQPLVAPAITLGLATVLAAPWLWRNLQLYGDPTGTALALATVDRRQAPLSLADLVWLLRGWFFSFWGKFGGAGHIALPWPFYLLWALLIAAALAGWLRWLLLSRREGLGLARATRPAAHVVLWGAPALVALYILAYSSVALGTDQGRLLFPAIAPLALLLAGGLSAWLPAHRPALLPAAVAGLMGSAGLLALYVGIVVPFAPPPAPSAADVASAVPVAQRLGNDLEVVGLHWVAREDAQPPTALVVYWRADAAPPADLRAVLHLFAMDGTLLWEAKRSPGAGRYSTDRWPAGLLLADEYALPSPAAAQMAHAELAVQPFPQGSYLPQTHPARPGAWVSLPMPEGGRD